MICHEQSVLKQRKDAPHRQVPDSQTGDLYKLGILVVELEAFSHQLDI